MNKFSLGNKKNILAVALLLLLVFATVLLFILRMQPRLSSLVLNSEFNSNTANPMIIERLEALNSCAALSAIKNPGKRPYAYFKFTVQQRQALTDSLKSNGNVALILRIRLLPRRQTEKNTGDELPFMYGFLYDDDFVSARRLKKEIEKRPLVTGNLSAFLSGDAFDILFSVSPGDAIRSAKIPSGFFVYAHSPVTLERATIGKALIGWKRGTIPLFAFAPNGGSIDTSFRSQNFAGATLLFPSDNTSSSLMPRISMELTDVYSYGSYDKQDKISLSAGGEKIDIRRARDQKEVNIETAALDSPFSLFEITGNTGMVVSLLMEQADLSLQPDSAGRVLVPYRTDPGLILDWKQKNWRTSDYELFEWTQFPGVLFFDTRNYSVQRNFFRRLAFYVEKAGYRGRLLSDEELGNMHGYNAHDYSSSSLAAFFTAVEKLQFPINKQELLLRDILLKNDVIVKQSDGSYTGGRGAVISISRESKPWLRREFVAHEGWHGIYFTDADYRNAVAAVYYTMDQTSLKFLTTYWTTQPTLNYDPADSYLMKNEFMAYIMQQPLNSISAYFIQLAGRGSVQRNEPKLAAYIRQTKAVAFEDAGTILNDYAFDHWGFAAGRVSLITR